MLLVVLDAYHLGDPLFIPQLARDVAARKEGLVFVHGSGEAGERAIEARGGVARQVEGVWQTASQVEAAEVERAARGLNRRIVHELNEAGVPAIRVMAVDRGLVSAGEGEALRAGRTDWLAALVGQHVVPVIATMISSVSEILSEADPAATAAVLAAALGAEAIVLLATGRTAGIPSDNGPLDHATLAEALASGTLPDAGLAERLVGATTVPVRVTNAARLREPGMPSGTRIGP